MTDIRGLIDTVVVVMMENRSFDHVLGFLSHESFDHRSDVDGLHIQGATFDWDNADDEGNLYAPTLTPDGYLPADLPHSRSEIATELNGGAMTGFIQAYFGMQANDRTPAPMRFCSPSDIPITAALARNYTVADRWFAAVPADTQPNRLMAWSGTTLIDSTDNIKPPFHLLPKQNTVFDWLSQKGAAFEIYVDADAIANVGPPSIMLLMESQWKYVFEHAHTLSELTTRWNTPGPAPSVIYCEPFFNDFATALGMHGNCNHPPLPMGYGEAFLKRVYEALTSNPARWARTVLIVCSDEHGGFFDHVAPPPMTLVPPAGNTWKIQSPMTTLGVRIPGIVVSPLVPRGGAFHETLDHTSILQLLVDRFGSPADLAFFGAAGARKTDVTTPIHSLAEVLALGAPRADDIIQLPPAPAVNVASAVTPPISNTGRMFRGVLSDPMFQAARQA